MKKNKKASLTLFIMVLVTFAWLLAYIVLANMENMNNKIKTIDLQIEEKNILSQNANLNLKRSLAFNSDWNFKVDNFKCPILRLNWLNIPTSLFFENGWFFCADKNTNNLKLSFSKFNNATEEEKTNMTTIFTQDSSGKYFDKAYDIVTNEEYLISGDLIEITPDKIFSIWSVSWPDGIDDNLNDDNYKVVVWDDIQNFFNFGWDNDTEWRTSILWIILKDDFRVNIFTNTKQSNNFIEQNTNNLTIEEWWVKIFRKISEADNIKLKIEINSPIKNFSFEVIKTPMDWWNSIKEKNISLDAENFLNYNFDFTRNYYQVFLNANSSMKNLTYKISTDTNTYINPIDDSKNWIIEIMQNYTLTRNWKDIITSEKFSLKK